MTVGLPAAREIGVSSLQTQVKLGQSAGEADVGSDCS